MLFTQFTVVLAKRMTRRKKLSRNEKNTVLWEKPINQAICIFHFGSAFSISEGEHRESEHSSNNYLFVCVVLPPFVVGGKLNEEFVFLISMKLSVCDLVWGRDLVHRGTNPCGTLDCMMSIYLAASR